MGAEVLLSPTYAFLAENDFPQVAGRWTEKEWSLVEWSLVEWSLEWSRWSNCSKLP